jgi:MFS family permease
MLALLFCAYVVSLTDRFLIGVLVDPIKFDLGLSDTQISLLQGVGFLVVYSVAGLAMGWLADRTHRPRLIAATMVLWTLATAFCGLANSVALLFVLRGLVAIGEASLVPAGMSLVAERSPPNRLGLAIVCFGLGGAVGGGVSLAVGGAVYGWLAELGGLDLPLLHHLKPWQGTFVLVALPGLPLALLTALLFDPRQGEPRAARPRHGVGKFCREAGSLVVPLMLAVSCMNGVVVGMTYWSAPLFVRAHGWSIQQAGSTVGFVFIGSSFVGALSAGIVSDYLAANSPSNRLALCAPAAAVALLAAVALGFAPSPVAALNVTAESHRAKLFGRLSTAGWQAVALGALDIGLHKGKILACKFDQYVPDHVDALSHIGMSRDQPVEQASYISAEENMVVGGLRVKQRRDRIPVTAVQR